MVFEQYYLGCLSHASYLVGDEVTGRAVVVDPQRDVSGYLADAGAHGLTIERVLETHVHADFLSGHLELAAATGATIAYGTGARVDYDVEELADGTRIVLGDVVLEVLATPGHTPESISVVVWEHAGDIVPYGVLTGDTLFIGDVGRPDLLASAGTAPDVLARQLYRSLHERLLALPDATRVYPAHGAGSACGRSLSSETVSTIGEQRCTNYALQPMTEDDFVAAVTEGQPVAPAYFAFSAHRNREARPLLDERSAPPMLDLDEVLRRRDAGAALLDAREPADFAAGHLRGAVNVGLQGRFAEYAGDVLSPDREIVLVGGPETAAEARTRLARIGFDRVDGALGDLRAALVDHPQLVGRASRLTIGQLAERRGDTPGLVLLDVRNPGERAAAGTVPGSVNVPLARLAETAGGLDLSRPTVVYCAGGYRSAVAASYLRALGAADVSDLLGGYDAWRAAGLPVRTVHDSDDPQEENVRGGPAVPEVTAPEGLALVEDGALLLDVREPDEWKAGHAPGATLCPLGQVQARADALPRDRRIVAVCRSGGRSAAVTQALTAWGFDAVNLAGGMRAWAASGFDVVTESGGPGRVA